LPRAGSRCMLGRSERVRAAAGTEVSMTPRRQGQRRGPTSASPAGAGRLRPIERCIVRLSAQGLSDEEIGARLHRSAAFVGRVKALTAVPRSGAPSEHRGLRPLERCVLAWRDRGEGYDDVAARFRRSPGFIEFVEELAEYKLSR
jgi:hypothetical protein